MKRREAVDESSSPPSKLVRCAVDVPGLGGGAPSDATDMASDATSMASDAGDMDGASGYDPQPTGSMSRDAVVGAGGAGGDPVGTATQAAKALVGVDDDEDVVVGFGSTSHGQLSARGDEDVLSPVLSSLHGKDIRSVVAGAHHSVVVRSGVVWTAGANDFGQLGRRGRPTRFAALEALQDSWDIVDASGGAQFTVVVHRDGRAASFGAGAQGQLGNGARDNASKPKVVKAPHSGGASSTGTVMGFAMPASRPRRIVHAAAGGAHVAALSKDGNVLCWGRNVDGSLGIGTYVSSAVPEIVPSLRLRPVVMVAAGEHHSLALTASGKLWAWGGNRHGQLGLGDTQNRPRPTQVTGLRNIHVLHVAAGEGHTAATGQEVCLTWGRNDKGQLGIGGESVCETFPRPIEPLRGKGYDRVACGARHTIMWSTTSNVLYVCGNGATGALGLGSRKTRVSPTALDMGAVVGGSTRHVAGVACGAGHSLVLLRAGSRPPLPAGAGKTRLGMPPTVPLATAESVQALVRDVRQQMSAAKPSIADVDDMSVGQLRSLLDRYGFDHSDVVEKSELVTRAKLALKPPPKEVHCAVCGKVAKSRLRCSRCKQVYYDVPECQRAHWPTHKRECVVASESGSAVGSGAGGGAGGRSSRQPQGPNPDAPEFSETLDPLVEMVESVFGSASVLNASFLARDHGERPVVRPRRPIGVTSRELATVRPVSVSRCGLDLGAMRVAYGHLLRLRSARVASTLGQATSRTVDELAAPAGPGHAGAIASTEPETLRVFMVLLLNPLLLETKRYLPILEKLVRLVIGLPRVARSLLLEWLRDAASEDFAQVIRVHQGYVRLVMTDPSLRTLDCSPAVTFLDLLHEVNLQFRIVPASRFYNPEACATVGLAADLDRFRTMPAAFSLCKYPFLLPLREKQELLMISARREMNDAVARSLLQRNSESIARSMADRSPSTTASGESEASPFAYTANHEHVNGQAALEESKLEAALMATPAPPPSGDAESEPLRSGVDSAQSATAAATASSADGGAGGSHSDSDTDDDDDGVAVRDVGRTVVTQVPGAEGADTVAGLAPLSPDGPAPEASLPRQQPPAELQLPAAGAAAGPAGSSAADSAARRVAAQLPRVEVASDDVFLRLNVRRKHVLHDAMAQLHSAVRAFPGALHKPLRVTFQGEDAVDEGGVRKEAFELLMRQLFISEVGRADPYDDETTSLSSAASEMSTAVGGAGGAGSAVPGMLMARKSRRRRPVPLFVEQSDSRNVWFSPTAFANEAMLRYTSVGRIVGLAAFNGILLSLPLPMELLFRVLKGQAATLEDLRQIQPSVARSLEAILDYDEASEGMSVEEAFGATFAVTVPGTSTDGSPAWRQVLLRPRGDEVNVTVYNREEFAEAYVQALLRGSVEPQLRAFYAGWREVAGDLPMALCQPFELDILICGLPEEPSIADLQRGAVYAGGFHDAHQVVRWFWEIARELSAADRRRLLQFATGSDRVPLMGLRSLKFCLQRAGDDATRMPVAHTCFNTLDTVPSRN